MMALLREKIWRSPIHFIKSHGRTALQLSISSPMGASRCSLGGSFTIRIPNY